jgi:tol-pal system protein YbgF
MMMVTVHSGARRKKMIRTLVKLAVFAGIAAAVVTGGPAWAQQQDVRDLVDRVERLERDLNILQSQFYRSQGGNASGGSQQGATVINSPAANLSGDAYSQLDQRISTLEEQMRDMTGQLEKAGHDTAELSAKIDRIQGDNDVRFKELEQKVGIGGQVAANAPPPAPASGPPGAQTANQPQQPPPADQQQGGAPGNGNQDWNPTMGSAPHSLIPPGQSMNQQDMHKLEPKNDDAAAPKPAASTQGPKSPQEQYDAAFALLRNNDDDGAAKAFQSFVAHNPKDPLAGNATYWMGQIAFSQGKFEQAAPIFFDAYSKYPKSAKAGESLLKVGLSMSNLNKKREACAALARFTTEFPDAADGLKRQSAAEKQKLGCG